MWIDHLHIVWEECAEVMAERRIGALLAPSVEEMSERPRLVVDTMPAAACDGPTASYRLIEALGLPTASPVRLSFTRPDAITDTLESLLSIAPGGVLLLVTAWHSGQGWFAACCLVSSLPITANSVSLSGKCQAAAESGYSFPEFMLDLHARYGEVLSPIPAQKLATTRHVSTTRNVTTAQRRSSENRKAHRAGRSRGRNRSHY